MTSLDFHSFSKEKSLDFSRQSAEDLLQKDCHLGNHYACGNLLMHQYKFGNSRQAINAAFKLCPDTKRRSPIFLPQTCEDLKDGDDTLKETTLQLLAYFDLSADPMWSSEH